ncbi:hypothetical protein Rhopal_003698-T1 [Rhodotorula paludigena]|uniref:Uncharacterized protein n=1 Tax=Rhodotorula paludigena TaxID=86838 RepID=A0AAV5GLE6_9BASI|nr:hypothetical protein Rhopal_003698-T1 [Rhodotorula paludigena]
MPLLTGLALLNTSLNSATYVNHYTVLQALASQAKLNRWEKFTVFFTRLHRNPPQPTCHLHLYFGHPCLRPMTLRTLAYLAKEYIARTGADGSNVIASKDPWLRALNANPVDCVVTVTFGELGSLYQRTVGRRSCVSVTDIGYSIVSIKKAGTWPGLRMPA